MAGKADFSKDEWEELQKGVTGAGMLVSVSHRDFTDSFGEASTLAKDLGGPSREREPARSRARRDPRHGVRLHASPTEVEEGTLSALAASVTALAEKAPDELDAYRASCSRSRTRSPEAKGGVQQEETAAIEKITTALGVS